MIVPDIIAALLIGTLSGMGIGGGGLLVIYLTLIRGMEQLGAQGLNLYFFIFASSAALFFHSTKRRINYPAILICSFTGMIFAYIGSKTPAATDPDIIRKLFGAMLIFAGSAVLLKKIPMLSGSKEQKK